MFNIWGFLIQTFEVSIMAILLLFIKQILRDKLSPRWQYGIWSVLLISIIMPAGIHGTYILPRMNVYIEAYKAMIESTIQSAYTNAFVPVYNCAFIPIIKSMPHSFTDILFVAYVLGIIVCLIRYMIQYLSIKRLLSQSHHPSDVITRQIQHVADTYQLKTCDIIVVDNLPSAFVCGVVHPILVLPENKEIDDKIILHELLHYKYKDSLHCVIWSVMRCFHWCNPLMHYVFNQINNDMESLCDQRVLELIEGEERRDYGRILLSMTNEKYPHAFATSCLSNGGKNIKKRIEAIVRFKKYPKGMSLVSICIGILLLPLAITGMSSVELVEAYTEDHESLEYQYSMASARMQKCSTVAGAIDTYAKGLLTSNDFYLTAVMPSHQLNDYQQVLKDKPQNILTTADETLYKVLNLEKVNHTKYKAILMFHEYYEIKKENESDENYVNYTFIPIEIIRENGWKVEKVGKVFKENEEARRFYFIFANYLPIPSKNIQQACDTGMFDISIQTVHIVENKLIENSWDGLGQPFNNGYSMEANMNAKFEKVIQNIKVTYTNQQSDKEKSQMKRISIVGESLDEFDDEPKFYAADNHEEGGGNGSSGTGHLSKYLKEDWDGTFEYVHGVEDYTDDIDKLPKALALRLYIDGKQVDEIKIDLEKASYVQ